MHSKGSTGLGVRRQGWGWWVSPVGLLVSRACSPCGCRLRGQEGALPLLQCPFCGLGPLPPPLGSSALSCGTTSLFLSWMPSLGF